MRTYQPYIMSSRFCFFSIEDLVPEQPLRKTTLSFEYREWLTSVLDVFPLVMTFHFYIFLIFWY